jgi:hypothetical protein
MDRLKAWKFVNFAFLLLSPKNFTLAVPLTAYTWPSHRLVSKFVFWKKSWE